MGALLAAGGAAAIVGGAGSGAPLTADGKLSGAGFLTVAGTGLAAGGVLLLVRGGYHGIETLGEEVELGPIQHGEPPLSALRPAGYAKPESPDKPSGCGRRPVANEEIALQFMDSSGSSHTVDIGTTNGAGVRALGLGKVLQRQFPGWPQSTVGLLSGVGVVLADYSDAPVASFALSDVASLEYATHKEFFDKHEAVVAREEGERRAIAEKHAAARRERERQAAREEAFDRDFAAAGEGTSSEMESFYNKYYKTGDKRVEVIRRLALKHFGPDNVARFLAGQRQLRAMSRGASFSASLCDVKRGEAKVELSMKSITAGLGLGALLLGSGRDFLKRALKAHQISKRRVIAATKRTTGARKVLIFLRCTDPHWYLRGGPWPPRK